MATETERGAGLLIQHRRPCPEDGEARRRVYTARVGGTCSYQDAGVCEGSASYAGDCPCVIQDALVWFLTHMDPAEVYGMYWAMQPGFPATVSVYYRYKGEANVPVGPIDPPPVPDA